MEAAKQTYSDLCHAYELLEEAPNPQTFRVLWVAALSLCRSIGYVLARDENEIVKKVSRKHFNKWKAEKNGIFINFIDEERNTIIHRGEIRCCFSPQLAVGISDDGAECFDFGEDLIYVPFPENLYDKYGDIDVRDLLKDAISWWDIQLKEIETEVEMLS